MDEQITEFKDHCNELSQEMEVKNSQENRHEETKATSTNRKKCTCPKKQKETLDHLKTKEELQIAVIQLKNQGQKLIELQSQLMFFKGKLKHTERDLCMENSNHQKTKEMLTKIKQQKKAQEEKNIKIQLEMKQLKKKLNPPEKDSANTETRMTLESLDFNLPRCSEKEHSTEIPLVDSLELQTANEELKLQLQQQQELTNCLKNDCEKQKAAHGKTKEELENIKIQKQHLEKKCIQHLTQIMQSKVKSNQLERDLSIEKAEHQKTKEELENVKQQKGKLYKKVKFVMKIFNRKIKGLENDLHLEESAHQKTKEALEAAESKRVTMKNKSGFNHTKKKGTSKKEHSIKSDSSVDLEKTTKALKLQLRQRKSLENHLKDNYEKEKAAHQNTKEELEQTNCQFKEMAEKCTEFKEDLLGCLSLFNEPKLLQEAIVALKQKYLEGDEKVNMNDVFAENYKRQIRNLKTKMKHCTTLLEASQNTNVRLEEKLSNVDSVYAKREQQYIQMINEHILKEHQLSTTLANYTAKCKKPALQKAVSWVKKKILQNRTNTNHEEEPPILYPLDWRLPGITDDDLQ